MRQTYCLRVFTALLLFLFCQAALGQSDEGAIVGQLRVTRGSFPPHRVEVRLESRGAMVGSTYSDDEGKFGFYGLKANFYHVTINDEAYAPVEVSVPFNPFINRLNLLQIALVPIATASPASLSPVRPGANAHMNDNSGGATSQERNVAGGNPYLVNPSEYSKHFPKDAVKEFEKGGENTRKGKIDDAVKHYQKALRIAPDFYPAHNDLGSAYLNKGDFTSAEREFQMAMNENHDDASAYFNLANLALLTNHYGNGLRYVDDGLKKQPNSAFGLFVEGSLYRRIGKLADSEKTLRDALQLDPSLAMAHLELVNLYRQEDNRPAIIAELQAFLKQFPDNPLAPRVRETLQKLQATRQK